MGIPSASHGEEHQHDHHLEKFLGGIRLAGALRPAEVLMQNFLSASKVFLDGRHKDIHIDRL